MADDKNQDFRRATVTIPRELVPFADGRAAEPEHAGNFSSYIRSLILRDKRERERESQPKAQVAA